MDIPFIETGERPIIHIKSDGDVIVKGQDDLRIEVASDTPEDVRIEKNGDSINIHSITKIKVRVPRDASLIIEKCSGNVTIKAVDGSIQAESVDGNLTVKSTGPVQIGRVSGNVEGKNIEGLVEVGTVDGNVNLRNLESFNASGRISGNLTLVDVDGNATARSDGNITLRLDPRPGSTYGFSASGNLVCRLPEDASLLLHITRAGGSLRVKIGEVDISRNDAREVIANLGDSDAEMTLAADGSIMVLGQAPEWDLSEDFDADFGKDIEGIFDEIGNQAVAQVEARMEMLSRHLDAQFSHLSDTLGAAGISAEQAARISEQARDASLRATERAQEKMRRAQDSIRRKMEQTQRKADLRARQEEARFKREERRSAGRSWSYDFASAAPQTPSDPVSEEERLVILKMLADKKISMDEAEKLLSALEGEGK